jgi:sphingomyelin phosphodiesterase acid-like 3
MNRKSALRAVSASFLTLLCFFLLCAPAAAQSTRSAAVNHKPSAARPTQSAPQAPAAVPALLVSDIHFEPFGDPAKAPQLAAAPASQWQAIFSAPPSPGSQQRFAALQQSCHVRGSDTSFALLQSSLKAMRVHAAGVRFVAVGGDLVSHAFQCEYHELFPHSPPGGYQAFVEKTLAYVTGELDATFPGTPVYIALGNNDTDCGDYKLDTHSKFLTATGLEVTKDFPADERPAAQQSFAAGGYYSVTLPAPIENARLLVLNDLFMSSHYATCAGQPDPAAAADELAWLREQLAEARANKQKVWVMGHIPPGVDLYSTAKRLTDVCGGQKPVLFLSSEKLADTLAENSDVIQLAIFAHTHMDELRLLKENGQSPASSPGVAVKLAPSISPVHANNPAFLIAQIDRSAAALVDYRVFTASNQTGVHAVWKEEYDFARSYHAPEFTSASVGKLLSSFASDPAAATSASRAYIRNFMAGTDSPLLSLVWPQYVCSLSNHTAQGFRSCVCPSVAH